MNIWWEWTKRRVADRRVILVLICLGQFNCRARGMRRGGEGFGLQSFVGKLGVFL